jgi:hypothetical protein
MIDLVKEVIQTNIDIWGEDFLIGGLITMLVVGVVITLILIKKNKL